MIEVKLKKLHSMSTVGTFKRIIPKRCQNGISPLSETAEESPFLHGNSPMKPFIFFTMAGIKPTIPDHFEIFFWYMPDQTLNDVNCWNGFNNIFIILVEIVMKSNGIPIVRVDSGCGDYRPSEVTADIFYYG